MRAIIGVLCFGLSTAAISDDGDAERQINETLRALPESLRAEATVVGYQYGRRTVLKSDSGNIIRWADDPGLVDARGAYFVHCFPEYLEAFENRRAELAGNPGAAGILTDEVRSGRLKVPDMAIRYTLRGHSAAGAVALAVLHVPFGKAEPMGLSAEPEHYRPWLMEESTVMAHIMLSGQ